MAVTELDRAQAQAIYTDTPEKEAARQVLLNELKLRFKLSESGIRYIPEELKKFQDAEANRVRRGFGGGGIQINFTLPHGVGGGGSLNHWSPFSVVVEDDVPVLYEEDTRIGEVTFPKTDPALVELRKQRLSTGEKFTDIANINPHGEIGIGYSRECSLKDDGEACLFCQQAAEGRVPEPGRPLLKTPQQVAEAYDLARQAGFGKHFRISGGFVPERRELEYYLDVVDAIRVKYKDFSGIAIIGAPADLSLIDKYKEAGYTHISHNMEVWDKDIFRAICPGKDKRNGGWRHWVDSLEYSVGVFGKGHVHSNIIGGLAPKHTTLEGIEYLVSRGVVASFGSFRPLIGTPLEGYRSPTAEWHWDLLLKGLEIYRRYGVETHQIYTGPGGGIGLGEAYRIFKGEFEGDRLDHWEYPPLGNPRPAALA
jgi:hypothetical protein